MTDTTTNLGLPVIAAAQAQKHVTHNEALRLLDTLVQLAVLDRDLSAPPGAPAEGERWIVAASPTDAWAGHADDIAAWQDGAWQFSTPRPGWVAFVVDEGTLAVWSGSAWGDFFATVTSIQNLALLGIGTTSDATNPFSAKLNKALWTAKTVAEGGDGDLRTTLNKETASDVLSLLLQRGYSGRAEIGLIGDDDLTFKVSADGSAWLTALVLDRTTGGLKSVGSINSGPLAGLRNMLRNGSFRVWQRGTSFSSPANNTYLADGWFVARGGSWTFTAGQVAHPSIPGRYGIGFIVTSAGTSISIRQPIGRVSLLDNESVTIGFQYKSDTAYTANVRIVQNFGTGGSPSSTVTTTGSVGVVNTAGALARGSATISVPTIVGKTLGTNGDDYVMLRIDLPTAACDVALFEVQCERGGTATPFEDYANRPLALELELCKRYFERIGGNVADTHFGKGFADSTTHAFADLTYSEKRATPSITVNGGGSSFEVQRQGSAVVATSALAATASHIGLARCQLDATVASGLTAGEGIGLKAKSTSGTIDISAELT